MGCSNVRPMDATSGIIAKKLKVTEQEAYDYHQFPTPGKFEINPIKPMNNQRDLSLAYSPGVAYPCLAINKDAEKAY